MIKFHPTKISHRLTITYAMLFFVALLMVNTAILISVNYNINQTSSQQLQLVNEAIVNEVKTLGDIPKIDLTNLSKIAENVDINLLYNNKSIYTTGDRYHLPKVEKNEPGIAVKGKSGENKIMYLRDTITLQDGKKIEVQIVKGMDNEDDYLHALAGIMVSIDVLAFLMAIMLGYFVSKKALSPIDKITNQAKQISASDLSARIHIDGPDDELKRLSDTFNDLISRIQLSYEKQNRFTLDASHELATPLAVIKGYTDVLDRWGKDDREVLNESIESIKVEIKNMTSLLDTLLFLSKGDNEIYKTVKTKFWLNELITEIVKETNLVNPSHKIYCSSKLKFQIKGDRQLIKQMLRAIIDNSIKYSAENTKIGISYKVIGKKVNIEIVDQGIGIPKNEQLYIFDRFYRVDKARSRSIGGAGLGLSLVKWIVEMHNGTVEVESELGTGTTMKIMLPLNS